MFTSKAITTTVVNSLAPGQIVGCTRLPGFFVRRQQHARIFYVRKHALGRRHFVSIGAHGVAGMTEPRARQAAMSILAALAQGRDPAAERAHARGMPTLAEHVEAFITGRQGLLKPGTLANYRGVLTKHIAPKDERGTLRRDCIGRLPLDRVPREAVAALHRSLRATPRAANHVLDLLSVAFSEAQAAGLVAEGHTPTKRIPRFPILRRQRFLSEEELLHLGTALDAAELMGTEDAYAIAAIRLLVLTGARRNEILYLRWADVDLAGARLTLPDSKSGPKTVLLSSAAIEVLRRIPRVEGNGYVIVGARRGQPLVGLRRIWSRVRDRARLEPTVMADGRVLPVRLHDLRHSYAALVASGGGSLLMIGALLGHTNAATTHRYAHLADDPLRQLAEETGRRASSALRAPS
ncbi:MAG: tyrosine-type recombinase/integrase [Hyphomicrobiaceae bacterium]